MRTLTAIVSFLIVATACALAGSDTNEFTLLKHQARRQAYEWRVSEARILATPEWSIDATNAPVAPERAWKIAKDWFKKKDRGEPDLVRMELRPFDLSGETKGLRKRFFYRIECSPMQFDYMIVIVLMDGTVLEPRPIPWLKPEELK